MNKKVILDKYEQDLEDNFSSFRRIENLEEEMMLLKQAAQNHIKNKPNESR